MTQTPSANGNSSRLDRIEAILERTVTDREVDRQEINELRSALTQLTTQTVTDREADRQQTNELRSALTQLTTQTVADREADRQQTNELREALTQLTRRVNNFVERMERYREQNDANYSELLRGQASIIEVIRQLTLGQAQLQQTVVRIEETQASLAAAQERQERILDYLILRSE
ncbi:hypothetical protein [Argonema galeatum]|uniref:hypothetical protein n=1 Tax=Argonema galeatum TaxID=2942762 RepID=UPI002012CDD5|nr:hypothetical protein [Argonema galeatum]MCL1464680.1 hypothetical protein [Argonema galeatum A003/A1]